MINCPVCKSEVSNKIENTPYWSCQTCDVWFQNPLPPKVYEASHEKDSQGNFTGHLMSDRDKAVNASLAKWLFDEYVKEPNQKVLDVGSKYPYLSHCLKNLGCDAFGMDNIEIVPEYSESLNVPMLMADFENITDEQITDWTKTNKFKLITLVHMFEHLYDPLEALRKLRRLVADDGFVYIRSPDHSVSGYERDLTPGHYSIHPYFWSLQSILELLVQGNDLFTVSFQKEMSGAGQRDIILTPINHAPRVWAGLIVKNEERDLPRCLRSIESVVDGVVIVDTGSVDKTEEAARNSFNKPMLYSTYTGASRQDETGDWKLWDFGKARNQFVSKIENETDADYVLWMDADDELLTPLDLKRIYYLSQYQVAGVHIDAGGHRWTHHRLWRTKLGIHFQGRCHEYPTMGGFPCINLTNVVIRHDAAPGFGENANARNLRILEEEFKESPTPRGAFYLANTHKDASRWAEAIPCYAKRIEMGIGYYDEWLFANLYKARCERAIGKYNEAEKTLLQAVSHETSWSEFWTELCYIAYDRKNWSECIGYGMLALNRNPQPTQLWREPNKYSDQPLRMISWSFELAGDIPQAYKWGLKAKDAIRVEDTDWNNRLNRLHEKLKQQSSKKKIVGLHRPGAIGDVIMTLNLVSDLREKFPEHEIHYFCSASIANQLKEFMLDLGVDEVHHDTELNEWGTKLTHLFNLVGYPLHEGYPEKAMKRHLLQYFADEMGLDSSAIISGTLEAYSRYSELPKKYATLQVKAGWSAYKNWPYDRWEQVLAQCPEIPVFQIGAESDPKIKGADHRFMGTNLMESIKLFSNASLHMGVDSFANHLTNFEWIKDDSIISKKVPAVILWGSTQESAAGYKHNENISLNLYCRPCFREDPGISKMSRGPCINPPNQVYENPQHACMNGIDVERVVYAIKQRWLKA